jgi:CHAT domain-containing protein
VNYTGDKAQESTAKGEAPRHRYLHFATHGLLNDASPLESGIVLVQPAANSEEDGFLTARENFDLRMNAELVVLSACNTARRATQRRRCGGFNVGAVRSGRADAGAQPVGGGR